MNLSPKKIVLNFTIFLSTSFLLLIGLTAQAEAQARSYSIESLDVIIDVNRDSTMRVQETQNYIFNGEFNGMFREITLENDATLGRCKENPRLQCGGFSLINIRQVLVNGEEVEKGRYGVTEVTDAGERRLRVQYRFDPDDTVMLRNESYSYTVIYDVIGGLGFFEDYDLFYWNALFPDRDVAIKKSRVEVNYPDTRRSDLDVLVDSENSRVETELARTAFEVTKDRNTVIYEITGIATRVNFTILQRMPKGLINIPGNIDLRLSPTEQFLNMDGFNELSVRDRQIIYGIPADQDIRLNFSTDSPLFNTVDMVINLEPSETRTLEVTITRTLLGNIVLLVQILANVTLLLLAFAAPIIIYLRWREKGRDKGLAKVIIPEFSPPDKIRPYLLGTIKDEKVDLVDISSTIIDLAYRGKLKIVEISEKVAVVFSKKDYKLVKLAKEEKYLEDLSAPEKDIFKAIFEKKDEVTLESLKYKFYAKVKSIQDDIYTETVDKGYFQKRPDVTRNEWYGIGVFVLVFGNFAAFFTIGLGVFTGFLFATSLGASILIAANYMPAKTLLGGQVLTKIRGFKMYLETAEKHTLQNLTPEMFEEYLAYAMVFGIEKAWAEKFKDIYTQPPSWYEGSTVSAFDIILFSTAMRSFNNSFVTTAAAAPNSSGSSSGGGWSGGGGFSGGFSGGGGGGGGGGAW